MISIRLVSLLFFSLLLLPLYSQSQNLSANKIHSTLIKLEGSVGVTKKEWLDEWSKDPNHRKLAVTNRISLNEELTQVLFIRGAKLNAQKRYNVVCDYQVTDPNGVMMTNDQKQPCLSGAAHADPTGRLTTPEQLEAAARFSPRVMTFSVDKNDPPGKWHIKVTLHDLVSGQTAVTETDFYFSKTNQPAVAI